MLENLLAMEQRRPPEYIIEVFADPSSVKDVVRGVYCAGSPSLGNAMLILMRAVRNPTYYIFSSILSCD
jgi:hypothetical protein